MTTRPNKPHSATPAITLELYPEQQWRGSRMRLVSRDTMKFSAACLVLLAFVSGCTAPQSTRVGVGPQSRRRWRGAPDEGPPGSHPWRRFWGNRNLSPAEIAFVSVTGDHADLAEIDDACTPQARAVGITLYKIDKIIHGTQVGNLGMASELRAYAFGVPLVKRS